MRLYVRASVVLQVAMMCVAAVPLMVATGVAVAATQWLFMWHNPAWWTVMRLVGYAIFTGYGCISLSAAWSLQAHLKQQLRDRWGRIVAVFLSANARAWHALVRTRGAVGGGRYTADSDDWDDAMDEATPDADIITATHRDPNNPPTGPPAPDIGHFGLVIASK